MWRKSEKTDATSTREEFEFDNDELYTTAV